MLHILLFLKAPREGFVKTRLAQRIGPQKALIAYRKLVERQVAALPPDAVTEVHYAPADANVELSSWLGSNAQYYPQVESELGARLSTAITNSFQRGASSVICIGGDCPGLSCSHFEQTANLLRQGHQLVVGPSEDGGYYLIGMNQLYAEIFEDIPWSSAGTLNATLKKADSLNLKVARLETLYDVDQATEFERALDEGLIKL